MTDWSKYFPYITTGMCRCGHSWEDHHLNWIMNAEAYLYMKEHFPKHPPFIPGECEAYGCNEMGGLDADGNDHCHGYQEE